MTTEVSARSGVCLEYEQLLSKCQQSLASWQQRMALMSRRAGLKHRAAGELRRLQSEYNRAYAELEHHEHTCPRCQFVSKIAGLDFECMSSALDSYRRSA